MSETTNATWFPSLAARYAANPRDVAMRAVRNAFGLATLLCMVLVAKHLDGTGGTGPAATALAFVSALALFVPACAFLGHHLANEAALAPRPRPVRVRSRG